MFALRVEYLTGRCVATTYNDRTSVEWPPHPARVFYALVSAWAEDEDRDQAERAALEWLEAQPPPALAVELSQAGRSVVTHFVPVNDTALLATRFGSSAEKLARVARDVEDCSREFAASNDAAQQKKLEARLQKLQGQLASISAELDAKRRADEAMVTTVTADLTRRAVGLLPDRRARQPRTFPSRSLADPVLHVIWTGDPSPEVREALNLIAGRVTHIGHSSSFVACRVVSDAPAPSLVPAEAGDLVLRVPAPGLLQRLVEAHGRHQQVEPRVMPCAFQPYAAPAAASREDTDVSLFGDDWIVFRQTGGPRLSSTLTADVAAGLRAALMSHADEPVHEALSGHAVDGTPSAQPHVAFVPLPFVGHRNASGGLLGAALVLPRNLASEARLAVLRAIGRWEAHVRQELDDAEVEAPPLELRLGARGVLEIERVAWGRAPQAALRAATWARPSRLWLSVTPVALDRNPGDMHSRDGTVAAKAFLAAGEIIAIGCERIGLPRPSRVEVLPSVTVPGVAKAREFPPFPSDRRKPQRVKVHALLEFDSPVRGPLLVGAGRFLGLGLFRPVVDDDEEGRQ